MYYCENCNEFYEDIEVPEWMEKDNGYIHRDCPGCGDDESLVPAKRCACGNWMKPDDPFCPECTNGIAELLDETMAKMGYSKDDFIELVDDYLSRKEDEE